MGTSVDSKIKSLMESKQVKTGTKVSKAAAVPESVESDADEDGADSDIMEDGDDDNDMNDIDEEDGEGDGDAGSDVDEDGMDVDEDEEEDGENDGDIEEEDEEEEEDPYAKHRIADSDEETEQIRDIQRKETKKTKREAAAKDKMLKAWEALQSAQTFESLSLSRPLLKALADLGFQHPTAIQSQTIPMALAGKGSSMQLQKLVFSLLILICALDICGSATTGSGKTAAFVLPILERLLYRDTRVAAIRVLVLAPTRELAVQCHSVVEKFAKYTNGITAALVSGGMSLKKQEVELSHRPDILVATPGRVVDHLLNTKAFGLDDLEILVIDEADRLMELGFAEQLEQIVKLCPVNRQTLLFSATMTERVNKLIGMSLKEPARVSVDPLFQVAKKLHQEFIRVRMAKGTSSKHN
jgi:ATP-dependent RNA helicase DDX27